MSAADALSIVLSLSISPNNTASTQVSNVASSSVVLSAFTADQLANPCSLAIV